MSDGPDGPDDGTKPPAPTGAAAAKAVATSTKPTPEATANALAYFMGDEPPPGRDERIPLQVNFGSPEEARWATCTFRRLSNEEFVAAADASMVTRAGARTIDPFVNASFVIAYSMVEPDLGEILQARRQKGDDQTDEGPLTDTAMLVRHVFRWQAGVATAIMDKIDERSRTGEPAKNLVLEVEAGKGSP
jgi:hypothetical protein